jgi:hypothetical protein
VIAFLIVGFLRLCMLACLLGALAGTAVGLVPIALIAPETGHEGIVAQISGVALAIVSLFVAGILGWLADTIEDS